MSGSQHLRAIVAIWLTNGQRPVDGANDTRELLDLGYAEAATATEALIADGSLTASGGTLVEPTAKGVFLALEQR